MVHVHLYSVLDLCVCVCVCVCVFVSKWNVTSVFHACTGDNVIISVGQSLIPGGILEPYSANFIACDCKYWSQRK